MTLLEEARKLPPMPSTTAYSRFNGQPGFDDAIRGYWADKSEALAARLALAVKALREQAELQDGNEYLVAICDALEVK